ncbi:MAG: hypothetical protein ISF22_08395 [Methanomassiliicoccus sp.]|nr:hypothetical protein [Methanomassiliicoccus sp.]
MNEFSLKGGSVGRGVAASVLAGIKYLLVPILVITIFSAVLAQAEVENIDLEGQLDLGRIMDFVIYLGTPIVVLSFFRGYYPKGSVSRFTFGVAAAALACVWIWLVMMGGNLALEFDQFGMSIAFVGFVLLFILAAALGGVYCLAEMLSYRREWLASQEMPPAPATS